MRSVEELMRTPWGEMEQDERALMFKEDRRRNPAGHAETQAILNIYQVLRDHRGSKNEAVIAERILKALGSPNTEWKIENGRQYTRRVISTAWVQDDDVTS